MCGGKGKSRIKQEAQKTGIYRSFSSGRSLWIGHAHFSGSTVLWDKIFGDKECTFSFAPDLMGPYFD